MSKEKVKKNQLELFLDDHEGDHYNGLPEVLYKVSFDSFMLDKATDGGLGPGIHRFGGASEGGKTSCALTVAKNFIATVPNSKVLIVKAEGRLGPKVKARSGLDFVDDPADWEVGKAWVFKCNIYDTVAQLIYTLITENPDGIKYFILVDSLDSLILKADLAKRFDDGDHVKVAGPNVLTKRLFKQTSLPISEYGHMMIVVAQVIASIDNKYEKKEQLNVGGAGGNAAIHFANFILQFMPRYKKNLITTNGKDAILNFDETNVCGHWCQVEIGKSENEKSALKVEYPIKYGTNGGGSVWSELEVRDMLTMYQLFSAKGAWAYLSENAVELMKKAGLEGEDLQDKFQGNQKFLDYIARPNVMAFWRKYIREMILNNEIL